MASQTFNISLISNNATYVTGSLVFSTVWCPYLLLFGIGRNVLVISVIYTKRRLQTDYYFLVCRLAISNLKEKKIE